mmetsp:Transcript_17416/g.48107  ORF Transcript_17416/g.48107 Transcript_17416/m.48107 type:complete len:117 (-) Transcript_17416:206-556(-)
MIPRSPVRAARQALAYGTLADLADGVAAVLGDPDVVVVRAKNRLGDEFGALGGTFRAVLLNLRLVSAEARTRGLAGHVCEVLLLLACAAGAPQAAVGGFGDGHERYTRWRDLVGER